MRKIEILIVVVILFLLAALVGCKDEAEARVESFGTSEPIQWGESYFLEVALTEEPTFADGETRIYLYKGDDFDVVIEKVEPNEPAEGSILIENDKGDYVWFNPEPNEPDLNYLLDTTTDDPNLTITSDQIYILTPDDFTSDTIIVGSNDTKIYLKNIHLLDKDELRDFALFISCATSNLKWVCDEYYEGILRLVPEKLLKEPD